MRGGQFYNVVREAQLNIQYLKPTEQRACILMTMQKPIILDSQIYLNNSAWVQFLLS